MDGKVQNDIARMTAVRRRFGDDMVLLTDANTGYTVTIAGVRGAPQATYSYTFRIVP